MMPYRFRLLVALTLTAATLTLFTLFDRYQVQVPQILRNGDFSAGFGGWRTNGDRAQLQLAQGILSIRAEQSGQAPGVRQTVQRDPAIHQVRLSAWMRHTGVAPGLITWHAARLLLVQKDSQGTALWELPHVVTQVRGDSPWRQVSQIFWLPEQVSAVEIAIVLNQVAGEMQVRGLTLDVVRERAGFIFARRGLSTAWLLMAVWLIWPLWRSGSHRRGRLVISALALVILAGTLTPHTIKNQLRQLAQAALQAAEAPARPPAQAEATPAAPRPAAPVANVAGTSVPIGEAWRATHKLGHMGLFAILALAAALTWRRRPWWRLGIYLGAFAVTAETLQLLTLDRSFNPSDAGLNLLGAAAGLALGPYLIRRGTARLKAQDPPSA